MMHLHSFSFNLLPVFTEKSNSLLTEPHLNIISKSYSIIILFVPHSEFVNHTSWTLCLSQGRVETVISQTLLGVSSSKKSLTVILMYFSTGLVYFRSVWQHLVFCFNQFSRKFSFSMRDEKLYNIFKNNIC